MPQHDLTEDEIAEIREEFAHFDEDNNGSIDQAEFTKLLDALDAQLSEEQVRAGLDALDTNRNGKIDFDEFLAWWSDR